MKQKIKQRLMEAAKARWAKMREETYQQTHGASATKPAPRIVAALDLFSLEMQAGSMVAQRGKAYFAQRQRFKLTHLDEVSASVFVEGSNYDYDYDYDDYDDDYAVEFALLDDDDVAITCECPYEEGLDEIICEHKIAAAMFLQSNYSDAVSGAKSKSLARTVPISAPPAKPVAPPPLPQPKPWRQQLSSLLMTDARSAAQTRPPALLFFSFIRRNHQYILQPGIVKADAVPQELWHDQAGLRDYLLAQYENLIRQGKFYALQLHLAQTYHYLNAPTSLRPLVTQILQAGQSAYYGGGYYQSNSSTASMWDALAETLVFRGNEQRLVEEPLTVLATAAQVELDAHYTEAGLNLSVQLVLPDRATPLKETKLEFYNHDPIWVCEGGELFRIALEPFKFNQLQRLADVVIPREAVGEFFQTNFAELAHRYTLRGNQLIRGTISETPPQPRLYLSEHLGNLHAALRFAYDGYECIAAKKPPVMAYVVQPPAVAPRSEATDETSATAYPTATKVMRQPVRELEWYERLSKDDFGLRTSNSSDGVKPDVFVLRKKVHPFEFLKDKVPQLAAAGVEVFGEADLTIGRINRSKPTISFNVSSGIDWFDVKTIINFGELEVSLAEVRKAMRNDRFIKLADGSIGEIPPEWLEKYKHLFGLSEASDEGLRVSRHHVALLDQLLTDQEDIKTDQKFEQAREWLKSFQGITEQALPQQFTGELRPYQKAGFDWLHFLRESKFGGCLADDMGTGKTIQTLCFLQSLKEGYDTHNARKRKKEPRAAHLLVVPRSLVTNWEREAEKFAPSLRILNFSNAERAADVKEFDDYDLVLTTYGILLREVERLMEYEFDTVILDEAQAIKNPVSESAKAARLLKARNKLTLTGTPVENNTIELWSQFAFLNPGLLGTADYFREGFANPIERQQDEDATKTLRKLVYPFILRRTKDQVALDLPPRSEKILWGEMEAAQRKLYNETRDEYRAKILQLIEDKGIKDARFRILEGLLRLRQICNDPRLYKPAYKGGSAKLTTLVETIETLQAEGHKALVFSQFVGMLKLIEKELKKSKTAYTYLDGSTTNRQDKVDKFQTDEDIKLFLISLKAGGVGLNLTAADYVIHVDPWWNPAVEMQATDRAHRIGQDKPVFVYKLLMRDSVEEKILQLQERKRTLVKNLISTEAGFFKALTADDIAALFS